jgi:3-phenylpropionate/trans-cinnamate dioxygenase ferredoxin subunit
LAYTKAAKASDIPAGSMKMIVVAGKEILVANVNGKHYAIPNRCTHNNGDLSKGTLEGNIVACPKHGQKFDIMTGKSIQGPKLGFLKMKGKDTAPLGVKLEGDDLRIDTG